MTERELEEYRALRATIRERGTARVAIFVATFAAWSLGLIATLGSGRPLAPLPLLLLIAAGFEAVFALHVGVERIGRYLQVFFEGEADTGAARHWERTAMTFGQTHPGGPDPLFAAHFLTAALLNLLPLLAARPRALVLLIVILAHALLAWRVLAARRAAGRQRGLDLERFTRIREGS